MADSLAIYHDMHNRYGELLTWKSLRFRRPGEMVRRLLYCNMWLSRVRARFPGSPLLITGKHMQAMMCIFIDKSFRQKLYNQRIYFERKSNGVTHFSKPCSPTLARTISGFSFRPYLQSFIRYPVGIKEEREQSRFIARFTDRIRSFIQYSYHHLNSSQDQL
jgi:hypothetical protein